MPYKMPRYGNKKGKSIGQIHPHKMYFQSNLWSFFGFDIYSFVGDNCNFENALSLQIL
jgi:hypothetical protein